MTDIMSATQRAMYTVSKQIERLYMGSRLLESSSGNMRIRNSTSLIILSCLCTK